MKPNRYRTQQPQPRTTHNERTPANHPQERATLATLLLNFLPTDTYTLTCQHALSLYITSPFQINVKPTAAAAGLRSFKQQSLQQLLKRYQANPQLSYAFTAQQNQVTCQDSTLNGHQSHKNYISLCRTATEGQLSSRRGQSDSSRKQASEKGDSNSKTNPKWPAKQRVGYQEKHNMFTVEQVKQSQQSDLQESLKENTSSQNKKTNYNFSQLHLNFDVAKPSERAPKNTLQNPPKKAPAETPKLETNIPAERNPLGPISNINRQPNASSITQPQPNHHATRLPSEQLKEANNSEPVSFTTQIRQGLIQNSSYQHYQTGTLKVMGDRQIEKQLNNKMSQNEASQISELSSIISTGHHGINSRAQINSIKNDIDIIDWECRNPDQRSPEKENNRLTEKRQESKSKAFTKKENQIYQTAVIKQEQKVEKVNLHAIAQQREEKLSDNVIITEKKDTKQPEFLVQYNLRFLQRKNAVTEVMRLSPLRFRPKEQGSQVAPKLQLRRPQEETNTS